MTSGAIHITADRLWSLTIDGSGSTPHWTWNTPPEALTSLLKDLFTAQPDDVLTWIHDAVWRMHARPPVVADSATRAKSRSPAPSRSCSIATLGVPTAPRRASAEQPEPGQLTSVVPFTAPAPKRLKSQGTGLGEPGSPSGFTSSPAGFNGSSGSMNTLGSVQSTKRSSSLLSEEFSRGMIFQQASFLKQFRIESMSLVPIPSTVSGADQFRAIARTRPILELAFAVCVLYEAWVESFWVAFMPGGSHAHRVIMAVALGLYYCDLLLHVAHAVLVGDGASRKYWVWLDLLAVVADTARACLPHGEVRQLAGAKALRAFHFLYLLDTAGCALMRVDAVARARFAPRLLLLHVGICFAAHAHAVAWALLHAPSPAASTPGQAFEQYLEMLWLACDALTGGGAMPAGTQGQQLLGILLALARGTLFAVGIVWVWRQALLRCLGDAQGEEQHAYLLAHFQRHRVSPALRLRAEASLKEAVRPMRIATSWQRLPSSLQQEINQEMWTPRLMTLGLIRDIVDVSPELGKELCMLVREEFLPKDATLFRYGEKSHAAYCVLEGQLEITYTEEDEIPGDQSLTAGMWAGEQALVNPGLLRMQTVTCAAAVALMAVPAADFHAQLAGLGLAEEFNTLIYNKLWRGLCGRCGAFGSHFSCNCPLRSRSYKPSGLRGLLAGPTPVVPETAGTRLSSGLSLFLSNKGLERLQGPMMKVGIMSLGQLNQSSLRRLLDEPGVVLTGEELDTLSAVSVSKFKEDLHVTIEREVGQLLAQSTNDHLVFLTHYKAEAGTEASLMQTGLEVLIKSDASHPGRNLARPVFLDTEDLRDLCDLTRHVQRSHNLVILLTANLLTRPWCLVEIVTAVEAGVRLVPVEIQRRDDVSFGYPDEAYYARVLAGTELDLQTTQFLEDQGIALAALVRSLRQVFSRIALPYSPHKTQAIREAELKDILRQCRRRMRRREDFNSNTSNATSFSTVDGADSQQ